MKNALFEKVQSFLELDLYSDYKVLDIGCGRGELLEIISDSMKTGSCLVGLDENGRAIEIAQNRYPNLVFHCEKFTETLSFEDDSFGVVLSVDTLECIPNKIALISENNRALKPDGKVLFAHWDWDTQVYNSANKSIFRKFVSTFSDWQHDWMETSDGQMGGRLWGLFEGSRKFKGSIENFILLETAFKEGQYGFDRLQELSELVTTGIIEAGEYEKVLEEMQRLSEMRQYLYSVNSYIYFGSHLKHEHSNFYNVSPYPEGSNH